MAHELGNMILPNESALQALDGERKALSHLERLRDSMDTVQEVRTTLQLIKPSREGPHAKVNLADWWQRHSKVLCAVFRPYATDAEVPADLPDARVGESTWTLAFLAALVSIDEQPEGRLKIRAEAGDRLTFTIGTEDFTLHPGSATAAAEVSASMLSPFDGSCEYDRSSNEIRYTLTIADGDEEDAIGF